MSEMKEVTLDCGHTVTYSADTYRRKHISQKDQAKLKMCRQCYENERKDTVEKLQTIGEGVEVIKLENEIVTLKCKQNHITMKNKRSYKKCPRCTLCAKRTSKNEKVKVCSLENLDRVLELNSCIRVSKLSTEGRRLIIYSIKLESLIEIRVQQILYEKLGLKTLQTDKTMFLTDTSLRSYGVYFLNEFKHYCDFTYGSEDVKNWFLSVKDQDVKTLVDVKKNEVNSDLRVKNQRNISDVT